MKRTTNTKATNQGKRHSEEFKAEALRLAESIGVAKASAKLGLYDSQIYAWRSKAQHQQTVSEREQSLATENAKLKRMLAEREEEVAILKKASAYFAKNQK